MTPSRRVVLLGAGAALVLAAAPLTWSALPAETREAILGLFGRAPTEDPRVSLKADAARPAPSEGFSDKVSAEVERVFGRSDATPGPMKFTLPGLAENGYSVNLSVDVDTPITPETFIRRIALFSERNPLTTMAQFHLTPRSGRAHVSTRVRLAGTQRVHAVAERSDGSLWTASAQTIVTLAACVVDEQGAY